MKKFRWRICLPVFNLLLAIGMSVVGLHQYEKVQHRFQGHGRGSYVPPAQLTVDSLNIVPFFLSNFLHNRFLWWRSFWDREWFYGVSADFFVLLFLFWFWVGWQLDVPPSLTSNNYLDWLAAALSLTLFGFGVYLCDEVLSKPDSMPFEKAFSVSALLWGLASSCFFGRRVLAYKERVRSR